MAKHIEAPSKHYLGDDGRRYFGERFNSDQEFGRLWQSRYFLPHCGPDRTVLDFGCGDGTILRALPAARKLAVEVNPHCVSRIEQVNAGLQIPVEVQSDIELIPSATVDVVISNHSLEHVPTPLQTLREVLRVLVPDGKLVLVTPFDDWRGAGSTHWTAGDRQNHLYTWSPTNIGNLLTEAGFDVQSSTLCSTAWSPRIFWVQRLLGDRAFSIACTLLGTALNRREVLSIASRPHS